jgi:hypothetical protein
MSKSSGEITREIANLLLAEGLSIVTLRDVLILLNDLDTAARREMVAYAREAEHD